MSTKNFWKASLFFVFIVMACGALARTSAEDNSNQWIKKMDGLIETLTSKNYNEFLEAFDALVKSGEKAVPFLVDALKKHPDPTVRRHSAAILAHIKDKSAVSALIEALSDQENSVQWTAITALGRIGNKQATRPLLEKLKSSDASVQSWIILALGEIGDTNAVPVLTKMLGGPQSFSQIAVLQALEKITGKSFKPVEKEKPLPPKKEMPLNICIDRQGTMLFENTKMDYRQLEDRLEEILKTQKHPLEVKILTPPKEEIPQKEMTKLLQTLAKHGIIDVSLEAQEIDLGKQEIEKAPAAIINLNERGEIYLNGTKIKIEDLENALKVKLKGKIVHIVIDRKTPLSQLDPLFKVIKNVPGPSAIKVFYSQEYKQNTH